MKASCRKSSRLLGRFSRRSVVILMLTTVLGGLVAMVGGALVPSGDAWAETAYTMLPDCESGWTLNDIRMKPATDQEKSSPNFVQLYYANALCETTGETVEDVLLSRGDIPVEYWQGACINVYLAQGVVQCGDNRLHDKIVTDEEIEEARNKLDEQEAKERCYKDSGVVGWILCPIIEGLSGIGEWMWGEVENNFLQIRAPELFNESSGIASAWSIVRNIANIMFIILFLVVIFSQITGVGINNYGIKKILPKLIVVAILVNLSYVICELAVDLSNIIGAGVNNLLSGAAEQVETAANVQVEGANSASGLVDGLLAGGAGALFVLLNGGGVLGIVALGFAVLGIVFSVVSAIIVLFLILIIRQAGVVLLIAIAPVAIVCYALPNTERLAKKWFDIFKALLVVYPLCGALIGAGKLASMVLASIDQPAMKVAALIVQVLPFFLIPTLLKSSLSLMGNVGARLSGAGKSLASRGAGATRGAITNSDKFKDWQQRQQGEKAVRRAQRIKNKYEGRSNLSEVQREKLLNAQKAINADTAAKAEAKVGVPALDAGLAESRAVASRQSQELKNYTDQYATLTQGEMGAELSAAVAAYNKDDQNSATRLQAAIMAADGRGMNNELLRALGGSFDENGRPVGGLSLSVRNGANDARILGQLSGSRNGAISQFGKQMSKPGNDGSYAAASTLGEFVKRGGEGSVSLQTAFGKIGANALNGTDDDTLQYIRESGGKAATTGMLLNAATAASNDKELKQINEMLRHRDDIAFASNEQFASLDSTTVDALAETNSGRNALLAAADNIPANSELWNKVDPEVKRKIEELRRQGAGGDGGAAADAGVAAGAGEVGGGVDAGGGGVPDATRTTVDVNVDHSGRTIITRNQPQRQTPQQNAPTRKRDSGLVGSDGKPILTSGPELKL